MFRRYEGELRENREADSGSLVNRELEGQELGLRGERS